jgi:hypothetical protein
MTTAIVPALYVPVEGIKVGATGFARTSGKAGRLIRFGEWLRWRNDLWNHVFTVVETDGTAANTTVVQATPGKGIVRSHLSEITNGSIVAILNPLDGVDASKVVEFALGEVKDKYAFGSDVCIALDIITPDWTVDFRRNGTWCCSALGAEANRVGGWYHKWPDIYNVSPTTLAMALGVGAQADLDDTTRFTKQP